MKKIHPFKITLRSERTLRSLACIAFVTMSAIALSFAGSPKDGSGKAMPPEGVAPTPTPTPSTDCTICHKKTSTLTFPCNSLEYRRHKDHGDPDGACASQGARREN